MNDRRVRISIPVVAGLALVTLLLLAGAATAGPVPPATSATQPLRTTQSWGSPWVPISRNQTITLEHNLGLDPYSYTVELMFLDTDNGLGINRRNYGGMEVNGHWFGAHWQNLTSNTIQVYRQRHDNAADLVRVRVFVPPTEPDYDSGWTVITPGQTITFNHTLGITATDLTVGLWFSGTERGIHHFAFGGLAVDGPQKMLGAHWQNLTTNTVQVIRHHDDTDIEQMRVHVVHPESSPDYDSGWQDVSPGSTTIFTHGLNWDPNLLLVRGECYDTSGLRGIHQLFAGSNHDWFAGGHFQGVHFQNLAEETVAIVRQPDDEFCPQVRVRIWKRGSQLFLPTVLSDYSSDGD